MNRTGFRGGLNRYRGQDIAAIKPILVVRHTIFDWEPARAPMVRYVGEFAASTGSAAGFACFFCTGGSMLPGMVNSTAIVAILLLAAPLSAQRQPIPFSCQNNEIGMRDTLHVWLDLSKLKSEYPDANHSASKLLLFLNGRMLKGLNIEVDPVTNNVSFDLKRTPDNLDAWGYLLGHPNTDFKRRMTVSVGFEDTGPITLDGETAFLMIRTWAVWASIALFTVFLWIVFRLASTTALLKDADGRYSLGRSQMAFWFVLAVSAYVMIAWISADPDVAIPNTILGLIGISAGTGLAAVAIDTGKSKSADAQLANLKLEKAKLDARLQQLPALIAAADAATADQLRREQAESTAKSATLASQIAQQEANNRPPTHKKFLDDLLSENDAISFHRFQMVVWTLVLGAVFVVEVWRQLAMPDFNSTLLALMGISSGTYVGFKIPDNT